MKKSLILLSVVALLAVACNKKESNTDGNKAEEYASVNKCINGVMQTYYLWNKRVPRYRNADTRNPEEYFESLLYADDRWSFIVDDKDEYLAESEGTPYSLGYSPQFRYYNDKKNVMILVEYVYPGSPADRAGLKRGDIILEINGEEMNVDNYYDLYCKEDVTYLLGTYDAENNKLHDAETISLKAEIIQADPSIYDTIFYVGGKPVGYYVFTEFTSGDTYHATIDAIFDRFKAAGVKDLILDLRYNGGGEESTELRLASAIAPASVVENHKVYEHIIYNAELEEYFRSIDEGLVDIFPDNPHNADMENLYVLGTKGTASASESVTIALMPYMNVILIGEKTYGKYTGMFYFYDSGDDADLKDLRNWLLLPVCFKYANAQGFTDFVDGLEPNYYVEDDLLGCYQFGDLNDPMLATAISVISGDSNPLSAKSAYKNPFPYLGRNKSVFKNNRISKMPKISAVSKD
ncbi:MAG: PDZ domain-containing protein [Salinivirgaceae bacterium]|nr:PDZ domain-containing protein [Salinivirgaceae bacterium]